MTDDTARTLDVTEPGSPADLLENVVDEASVEPTAGMTWTLGWCDVMITQPAKVNVRDKSYLDAQSDAMSTMSTTTRTALNRQNSALGGNKKR
jgi:hypothetical protein